MIRIITAWISAVITLTLAIMIYGFGMIRLDVGIVVVISFLTFTLWLMAHAYCEDETTKNPPSGGQ